MKPRNSRAAVVGLLALWGTAGCQSFYRCDTVLHQDGRVERKVVQPPDSLPAAARRPGLWKTLGVKDVKVSEGSSGSVQTVRSLVAEGEFRAPQAIPDHIVFKAPEGSGLSDSRLERQYTRTDFVFVVEHRWKETLTDAITYEGMKKARQELADLLIELLPEAVREGVGPDYDVSGLEQWLRREGRESIDELTDRHYLDSRSRRSKDAALDALASICDRHGLHLMPGRKALEGDALDKVCHDYVVALLARKVRGKDGKPISKDTAAAWLAQNGPLATGWDRVMARKYRGDKELGDRMAALAARILGRHFLLAETRHFDFAMTMPGVMVQTNGQTLADNRIHWQFDASEAYPTGYDMTCRSLGPRPEVQKAVLGREPLTDPKAMQRFVDLVAGRERLLGALRECPMQKSPKPLRAYREMLAGRAGSEEEIRAIDEVLRLLGEAP
jgi:hypothetical protein